MSVSALLPTAPTTLVIVLGASAWPNSPGLPPSKAFTNAAQGFKDYMCDPHSFGLPSENLLDLFDAETNASDQLETMGFFLEQQMQVLSAAKHAVRDVQVYFVGHGAFAGPSADFYLMHHRSNERSLRASGLAIEALAEVLREKARHVRRYLFLDCCFAAAAFSAFQGGPDQVAIKKTQNAFSVRSKSTGFPEQGTVLLCSSDQKTPSQLLPDESSTMFSHALLAVLRDGDLHRSHPMSLRDIKELVEDQLVASPEKNAPYPTLLSPDQSKGDVADVPFFPNPRVEEEQRRQAEEIKRLQAEERVRSLEEERVRKAKKAIEEQSSLLLSQTLLPKASPQVVTSPQDPTPSAPILSPQATISPPRAGNLLFPPITKHPKRQHLPAVVILLLILLSAGSTGVYRVMTGSWPWNPSPWHTQISNTPYNLSCVAWSGSQFVVVGDFGTILTSSDGHTWTVQNSGTSDDLIDVIWADSQFVAVGDNHTLPSAKDIILTSPDGHTWTAHDPGTSQGLLGVAWSGSQFVVVEQSFHTGVNSIILTSPDGHTWTAHDPGTSQGLLGVAWSGSQFVVVGTSGTILTSSDGRTWTTQSSGTSQGLLGVAWSGAGWFASQFVAVGTSGTILTSSDGHTWATQSSGTSQALRGVAWLGSQFVAVGDFGTILTSSNGHTWTIQNSGTSQWLSGVGWSGPQFVAVGTSGTILTSP